MKIFHTTFRDVFMLALLGVLAMVVIMFPHINPEGVKNEEGSPVNEGLIAELVWDSNLRSDLDLWVLQPNGKKIGFSRKGDRQGNLLRDDLGAINEVVRLNVEYYYSRGFVPGRYTFNVHFYRPDHDDELPIEATVVIRKKKDNITTILYHKTVLLYPQEQITIVTLTVDGNGKVIAPPSTAPVQIYG